MAKRKLIEKLVDKSEIREELRLINESDRDYITPSGKVYADYGNNKFYLKTPRVNKHNGYVYIGMYDFNTDQLLDMFINCAHASQITNISSKTISHQVSQNRKPKNKFKSTNNVYFLPIYRR